MPHPDGGAASCDGHNDTQLSELKTPDSPSAMPLAPAKALQQQEEEEEEEAAAAEEERQPSPVGGRKKKQRGHSHGHGHSHGGHCHSDQEMKDAGIASIAWMVIMGDGMHNFSDGLAIGERLRPSVSRRGFSRVASEKSKVNPDCAPSLTPPPTPFSPSLYRRRRLQRQPDRWHQHVGGRVLPRVASRAG